MKVWYLYNQYRSQVGGEEVVVQNIVDMMQRRGSQTKLITRNSKDLEKALLAKIKVFWSGMYSFSAHKEMIELIQIDPPDIVHAHNLYPLFSASVLAACRQAGIPTIMMLHNYSLTCPNWAHLYDGEICERCEGGREFYCILKNCRNDIFESIGYAMRSAVARKFQLFHKNVTMFIALTPFAKRRLVNAGFAEDRIFVLPNMVHAPDFPTDPAQGEYIAYVGRVDPVKGVDTLSLAARITKLPVRVAGTGTIMGEVDKKAPANLEFLGKLDRNQLGSFYRKARFMVVPSKWFEVCPMVILEAFSYGLPVIASRIGGLPELVQHGHTGLLFETGDAEDLASKMMGLWNDPNLCQKMGSAGRSKVLKEHSEDIYYHRLTKIYQKAIEINREQ
jgi:glycosyltransferase involved in cell wall biosynthesis